MFLDDHLLACEIFTVGTLALKQEAKTAVLKRFLLCNTIDLIII